MRKVLRTELAHFFRKHARGIDCQITGSIEYLIDRAQGGLEISVKPVFRKTNKRMIFNWGI